MRLQLALLELQELADELAVAAARVAVCDGCGERDGDDEDRAQRHGLHRSLPPVARPGRCAARPPRGLYGVRAAAVNALLAAASAVRHPPRDAFRPDRTILRWYTRCIAGARRSDTMRFILAVALTFLVGGALSGA